ncbi:MAG TPA: oligosaccharide flippase family protein [Sphingomicrobium sp.]
MTGERDSYRRIFVSTAMMGGATIVAILVGVVRTKIFALTIGPAGIGLIGVLTSVMATAAAIGGMGLGFSGVRQIASSERTRGLARRALWLGVWPLALVTALVLWFARAPIARWVTGSEAQALGVGLMGLAAALTILAGAQTTVIQGMGNVAGVAKARVWGAILSLLIGVPAVLYAGPVGIALAVIGIPLGNLIGNLPYRPAAERNAAKLSRGQLAGQLRELIALGVTFMATTALAAGTLVVVRTLVIRADGMEAAGLYQAAYSISALNASLVLSAMATDYFPRLSAAQDDRAYSATMVNQQLRAALLLASPVLIGMVALAPLVLQLLYSGAFTAGADLLRWQLTGELLKLPGWALGFLLLARADKSRYLLVESAFVVAYVGGTAALLPLAGLKGAGFAYLGAYLLYSLLLIAICGRRHGAIVDKRNRAHLLIVGLLLVALSLLGGAAPWAAGGIGLAAAAAASAYALRHIYEIRKAPPAPAPLDLPAA